MKVVRYFFLSFWVFSVALFAYPVEHAQAELHHDLSAATYAKLECSDAGCPAESERQVTLSCSEITGQCGYAAVGAIGHSFVQPPLLRNALVMHSDAVARGLSPESETPPPRS